MKKLVLTLAVLTVCYTANAQEPEKKKESATTPAPSRGQERAINESGVSVKSEKKSSSNAKATPATTVSSVPGEEKKREAKKPE
jgi:hypothetical protein